VGHRLRRRRSAGRLPPLPTPADIPEDAAGRVEFITAPAVPAPAAAGTSAGAAVRRRQPRWAALVTGWTAVIILGMLIAAVFVIGLRVTG